MKPTLTILIGNGVSEAVGMPSTVELTRLVRGSYSYNPLYLQAQDVPISEALWRMATSYYTRPNFETILHLAETVLGYRSVHGWLGANDRIKPAFGAFMNIMPHWRNFVESAVNWDLQAYLNVTINEIAALLIQRADIVGGENVELTERMFHKLSSAFKLVIATLNYDDLIERALHSWNDGFAPDGHKRLVFNPRLLMDADTADVELCHLHGSVRFYTLRNEDPVIGSQILKAEAGVVPDAAMTRVSKVIVTQAGEFSAVGPMISGLRKSDKISIEPYASYHWRTRASLLTHPRALVIGYAGWDTYLTELLQQFKAFHGEAARMAVINYCEPGSALQDFGFLVGGSLVANNFRVGLDEAFETHTWSGTRQYAMFANGMPLGERQVEELLDFLNS